ncbi:unnamed protein product [Rotaria socialis]|uniref:Transporter n=1 Tax=Rotaria socialis TaxID=392032 RepID=A0A817K4J5_9BILA|nr:unnamed protein product [Rotaria socialis]CAF3651306.1 unnamed protein product [Rotaria socialis]CAF3686248.1 unnamed protein product [Rotaria socialis]
MLNRVRALIRSRSVLEQPFEEGRPTNSKEEVREEWDRPIEFILSLVGCSVGLGNVWRYPYIAFKNGGGAFLIPYFCVYFLIGTPLYFLELSLGQFGSRGTTVAFKMTRMFKGIGWAMAINSFLVTIYYNVIIAWCLFYFFASFRRTLPWSGCDNWWNTPSCSNPDGLKNSTANFLCLSGNRLNNCSIPTSPPEEYFDHFVLRRSDSMEAMGSPHWSLALCLLLAWILVAICIIQGIKSSGKVWIAAASQVTFSLSVGFGSILGYASFNKFKSNYLRDCLLVTACDCFTSVFAGFAVFPILGFMSYKTGLPVDQVVKAGPGLAFIAYPQALSIMPGGPFWAVTFFFMLLTLGLDSQFALSDVTISGLLDNFSGLRRYKPFVIIGYCVACYLLALPMCAPIVFFSSIIQFRAPTEGNYTYLPYANALGWLMVGSSLIFIPGVMIYEFFKAWKVTNRSQNQITDTMPRYLRMLTYVSQPDDDWGPTRKEYQCGRYEKLTNTTSKNDRKPPDNEPVIFYNENINDAFDPAADLASRF